MEKEKSCCESFKTKERTQEEKRQLTIRLNKIAGQLNGIQNMIEQDRYCGDVLIQVSAVEKSLKSVANMLLKKHMETCMVEEIKKDNIEIIDEVMTLFKRLS